MKLRKLKDMLKPVVIRWVESRSEVERLERKVQQMRALLEHQTRVNEQYRPYYDGTLDTWRKHTKKRIELVERLLVLPDLFAFDVPDDEIPHMLKQAGFEADVLAWSYAGAVYCVDCHDAREDTDDEEWSPILVESYFKNGLGGVCCRTCGHNMACCNLRDEPERDHCPQCREHQPLRHFVQGDGELACGEELLASTLTTKNEMEVSCEMCLEVIITTFPVHWQLDTAMRVACGAKAEEGKPLNMTFFAVGVTCPECKPIAMEAHASILRCQLTFGRGKDEKQ